MQASESPMGHGVVRGPVGLRHLSGALDPWSLAFFLGPLLMGPSTLACY